jgi:hypothetical protein
MSVQKDNNWSQESYFASSQGIIVLSDIFLKTKLKAIVHHNIEDYLIISQS